MNALGIDVGGTKIAAGLVDLDTGTIANRREIPTVPQRGGTSVLEDVISLANDCHFSAWDYARQRCGEICRPV